MAIKNACNFKLFETLISLNTRMYGVFLTGLLLFYNLIILNYVMYTNLKLKIDICHYKIVNAYLFTYHIEYDYFLCKYCCYIIII